MLIFENHYKFLISESYDEMLQRLHLLQANLTPSSQDKPKKNGKSRAEKCQKKKDKGKCSKKKVAKKCKMTCGKCSS